MNAQERKEFLKTKQLIFGDMRVDVKKGVEARTQMNEELTKINMGVDWTDDAKTRKKTEISQKYADKFRKIHAAITDNLGRLEKMSSEAAANLDLSTPEFTAALKLIEMTGKNLDTEVASKMLSNFVGDQAALRALQPVFKSRGLYDTNLNNLLYEIGSTFEKLRELTDGAFMNLDGSINALSAEISRLAAKEGLEFPRFVDQAGFEAAAWRGAGLSAQ